MKDRATSFDIAHHAGVSQSTVSRALRNSPLVNKETRERIQAIAKALNYKVDKNASNLRQQQSRTLALLLFEDPTSDDSMINPFFLSMLGSITRAATNKGYDLLVSFQQFSDDWHADFEDTNKADGIILLGYGDFVDYSDRLAQLEQQGTRFVRWGAIEQHHPGITIGCDNLQGGHDVTQHLLNLGRQKLVFIGGADEHCPEFLARFLGFNQALIDAELLSEGESAEHWDAISTETSGYHVTQALLASEQPVDAIVCASDLIAVGVISALRDSGIKVPEQIAVVGFDNIQQASFTVPPLTTVRQDTMKAGALLVDSLVNQIENTPQENHVLPVDLVIRRSCGATPVED